MARPYSLDLRERVVAALNSDQTCRQVAQAFGISVSSAVKWSQRKRMTGSPAAAKMGGHRPYLLEGERDWLLSRIAEKSDLTLHTLLFELKERGTKVCCDTLWRFLRREGVSFKKNAVRKRTEPA